jgi:hypothetical protein
VMFSEGVVGKMIILNLRRKYTTVTL